MISNVLIADKAEISANVWTTEVKTHFYMCCYFCALLGLQEKTTIWYHILSLHWRCYILNSEMMRVPFWFHVFSIIIYEIVHLLSVTDSLNQTLSNFIFLHKSPWMYRCHVNFIVFRPHLIKNIRRKILTFKRNKLVLTVLITLLIWRIKWV